MICVGGMFCVIVVYETLHERRQGEAYLEVFAFYESNQNPLRLSPCGTGIWPR